MRAYEKARKPVSNVSITCLQLECVGSYDIYLKKGLVAQDEPFRKELVKSATKAMSKHFYSAKHHSIHVEY